MAEDAPISTSGGRETVQEIASDERDAPGAQIGRPIRTAVVGMSVSRTCGVRDYAGLLVEALSRENVSCSEHWLLRGERSLRAGLAEVRAWSRALAAELDESQPDAVLLHYSIFAYSYRGFPVFVRPTLSALRGARIPLVTLMHEFAYPWMLGGWRGNAWALAHRALLIDVMRASAAVLVTTDFRAEYLTSRRWLARRPLAIAPVFSTLPPPVPRARPDRDGSVLGLFGYAYDSHAISLVLDALRLLKERGSHVRLVLLGAPGRESALAEAWLKAAGARDLTQALSFAGPFAAQDLSNALAACDVLLFADTAGPSSRKTTLAGSLASGRPVIAVDGPRTWSELVELEAARIVQPSAAALADAIAALLGDVGLREALGARGRAFAEERMGVAQSATVVTELLGKVLER
ncbi:MAG TPA: glycosyltransferase [Solirubrobacteraceae bacterium]|nr:glycosyltransferase [Solirubrobacteraceae bacterium]